MGQTVNLLVYTFGGSNPSSPTLSSVRITVSTQDSQSCNRGSIPLPSTKAHINY